MARRDARVSVNPETKEPLHGRLVVQKQALLRYLLPGGFFCVTSCNNAHNYSMGWEQEAKVIGRQ
jgi:hypothetical protein